MTGSPDTSFTLAGAALRWRPYRLCAQSQLGIDPPTALPPGWAPDPKAPLDAALPFGWDDDYRQRHGQAFQPVRFWQNATALAALVAEARARGRGTAEAEEMLIALVKRMREFIRKVEGARFIENRFRFASAGMVLPAGWVSAIANAFVILGCVAAVPVLPGQGLEGDVRRLADAFARVFAEGGDPPDRWISYRDRNGYLWFEEYPEPGGAAQPCAERAYLCGVCAVPGQRAVAGAGLCRDGASRGRHGRGLCAVVSPQGKGQHLCAARAAAE